MQPIENRRSSKMRIPFIYCNYILASRSIFNQVILVIGIKIILSILRFNTS